MVDQETKKDFAEAVRELKTEWDNKHLNLNDNAKEQKERIA
jgi:hypothetical protein